MFSFAPAQISGLQPTVNGQLLYDAPLVHFDASTVGFDFKDGSLFAWDGMVNQIWIVTDECTT